MASVISQLSGVSDLRVCKVSGWVVTSSRRIPYVVALLVGDSHAVTFASRNACRSSCKIPTIVVWFLQKLEHVDKFIEIPPNEIYWKPPFSVCYMQTDRKTHGQSHKYGEATVFAREKQQFLDKNLPSKIGVRLIHGTLFLLTTEPATPVLYVVKLSVETASVWDCYLAGFGTLSNVPTYYWCIGIFWLHESSQHHQFPEVGRPWHHWQITVNAASDNQSAANAIANILLSHRLKSSAAYIRVISKFLT
jgi:hypothetical protein